MDTNNLLRQHQEMLDLAAKISAYQSQLQVKENGSTISTLLSQLAGKLKMHLMVEDQFVYPKLAMHSDVQIQKTSQNFANEMGDLGKAFDNYKTRYMGANKIADNADMFITDTKNVVAALTKRMDKENQLLYPLLSK
ncbi:MAG: Hemerythrin cation binding domain protein [Firmicutes bacterium]|nr:Hemerythrin cation binding domain protein [Bacillota bacterium]